MSVQMSTSATLIGYPSNQDSLAQPWVVHAVAEEEHRMAEIGGYMRQFATIPHLEWHKPSICASHREHTPYQSDISRDRRAEASCSPQSQICYVGEGNVTYLEDQ
jgi:hypothetical protein